MKAKHNLMMPDHRWAQLKDLKAHSKFRSMNDYILEAVLYPHIDRLKDQTLESRVLALELNFARTDATIKAMVTERVPVANLSVPEANGDGKTAQIARFDANKLRLMRQSDLIHVCEMLDVKVGTQAEMITALMELKE